MRVNWVVNVGVVAGDGRRSRCCVRRALAKLRRWLAAPACCLLRSRDKCVHCVEWARSLGRARRQQRAKTVCEKRKDRRGEGASRGAAPLVVVGGGGGGEGEGEVSGGVGVKSARRGH